MCMCVYTLNTDNNTVPLDVCRACARSPPHTQTHTHTQDMCKAAMDDAHFIASPRQASVNDLVAIVNQAWEGK